MADANQTPDTSSATQSAQDAQQSRSASGSSSGQNQGNQRRGGRGRNHGGNQGVVLSNPKDWEGATSELGAVVCLKNENLDKRATFEKYTECVKNYILRTYNDTGRFMTIAITERKDPLDFHKDECMPKNLTVTQQILTK